MLRLTAVAAFCGRPPPPIIDVSEKTDARGKVENCARVLIVCICK